MFFRSAILIVGCVLIAATLLGLRQQRLNIAHEMAQTHRELDQARQRIWQVQTRVAAEMDTPRLRQVLRREPQQFEPATQHAQHTGVGSALLTDDGRAP